MTPGDQEWLVEILAEGFRRGGSQPVEARQLALATVDDVDALAELGLALSAAVNLERQLS